MNARVRRAAGPAVAGTLALFALTACRGSATTRAVVELAPGEPSAAAGAPAPQAVAPAVPVPVRPSLLINRPQPFTESEVSRLRRLRGVTRLALIGYGPVYVYGEQIPTAAIDPATYRSFTPPGTGGSAPVWKAVQDGKALVSHTVGERDHLPLDATVPAGWGTVRIAGLATTVPGVDMVVGATTGERIGVPFGNGLVVAVQGDPEKVAAKVRQMLSTPATIRRIADSDTIGMPAAPLLPSVGPAVPAKPGALGGAGAPGAPAGHAPSSPPGSPSAVPVAPPAPSVRPH